MPKRETIVGCLRCILFNRLRESVRNPPVSFICVVRRSGDKKRNAYGGRTADCCFESGQSAVSGGRLTKGQVIDYYIRISKDLPMSGTTRWVLLPWTTPNDESAGNNQYESELTRRIRLRAAATRF